MHKYKLKSLYWNKLTASMDSNLSHTNSSKAVSMVMGG